MEPNPKAITLPLNFDRVELVCYTSFMNTKTKGDIAVANAIACYVNAGYEVLLPLGDKRPYDMVIDDGKQLLKVQVKYAGGSEKGVYQAHLRTVGGNQSFQTAKKYADDDFDLLFVWCSDGRGYSIPWSDVTARSALTIGKKYEKYNMDGRPNGEVTLLHGV